MNIKRVMNILVFVLLLLSSCTRNLEVEEKTIVVKDEKSGVPVFEKVDEEAGREKERVENDDALSAFYSNLIDDTFSILSSRAVETESGVELDEVVLESENGSVVCVYQTSDGSTNYLGFEYRENLCGYVLVDGSRYCGELYIPPYIDSIAVVAIDSGAFRNNSDLMGGLFLPDTILSIGDYAFQNCTGLTHTLMLPPDLLDIGKYAFEAVNLTGDIVFPSSLSRVGEGAFKNSSFDGMLFINDGIEKIEDYTFCNTSLTGDLILPSSVKEIGAYAFDSCLFDNVLFLNDGIETISDYAFKDNVNLFSDIYLPPTLLRLSENAFEGCRALEGRYFVGREGYVLINSADK